MHPKYPHVFSPFKIGPVELRNRFYSSPHAMPFTGGGKPTDDYLHYILARAKGGLGLIMLSLTIPDRSKGAQPSPEPKQNVPAFRALADAVHGQGTKLFGELFYQWCAPGVWQSMGTPAPIFAPSVSQYNFVDRRAATREMSKREISAMVQSFANAAANLRDAGFDGVMIHSSHGVLIEQFLSPYFNHRTDEYGGSLTNRMRLLREVLAAVRKAIGDKMALGVRLNCDELLEGGYHTKEAYQILKTLADAKVIDFADLDTAIEPEQFYIGMPPVFVPPHPYKPYVEAVRGAAGKVPVLSVLGRMTQVADAEQVIAAGICDMVGAARAHIAEPELVKNAFEGKEERSRTCIACNACMAAQFEGMQGCAINPASYRERYWGVDSFTAAPRKSKVVVVGAGPAGLEAARVARLRGHDVVLFEARDKVGGALALWSSLPGREFYHKAIDWWAAELQRLGVDVRLNTTATSAAVLAEKPDAVIIAAGALYSTTGHSNHRDLDLPGYDQPFVYRPEEVLLGKVKPSGKVIVLDSEGLHTGVGIAEMLATAGAQVELLTPYYAPTAAYLANNQDAHFIIKRLYDAHVTFTPMSYIKHIGAREVTIVHVHSEQPRVVTGVDAVILATGRVPQNALEKELDGKVAQLFSAGDALAPRFWLSSAYEGHKFARLIGEPNAAASIADIYFGTDDPIFSPMPADMKRA